MSESLQYWDRIVGETRGLTAEEAYKLGVSVVAAAFVSFSTHTPKAIRKFEHGHAVDVFAGGSMSIDYGCTDRDPVASVRWGIGADAEDVTFYMKPHEPVTLKDAERVAFAADAVCRMLDAAYIGSEEIVATSQHILEIKRATATI